MSLLYLRHRAAAFASGGRAAVLLVLAGCAVQTSPAGAQERIPNTEATALDGHPVVLPRDLPGHISVLILGFGQKSADPTTAWEKPVRGSLNQPPAIGFYDMPMLASAPKFLRGWIVRAIRNKVPEALRPNFVPLTVDEDAWRRTAGYDEKQPDAPYVLLVDRSGTVRWKTHESYTPEHFAELAAEAKKLAGETR